MFGFVCLFVCFGRLTVLLGLFSKKLPRIKFLCLGCRLRGFVPLSWFFHGFLGYFGLPIVAI